MTNTPMIDAAATWFSRWLGASSVRERDREYARDLIRTILAAAQPSPGPTPSECDPADDEDRQESEPRRLLDQAIANALPLAGGRVRKLLKALRRELVRVDAKRAEQAEG